ncbi:MAG: class I SAM-dependent methyltransferase [Verrucomicrobiota bacterium]
MSHFYDIYHNESLLEKLDQGLPPRGDESLIQQLQATLKATPDRIVDIGCGHGGHTFALAEAFPEATVVGVDPYRPSLEEALEEREAEDKERVGFIPGTIEALPFEDASTDLIWCFDMLCHSEEPVMALMECHRILQPGGTLMLSTAVTTPAMEEQTWSTLSPAGLHLISMDQAEISKGIQAVGFEVIAEKNYRSEFLEAIEAEDPGRVSKDFIRMARLQRDPEHWKSELGADRIEPMQALLAYNLAILSGKLDYYCWQVIK